MDYLTLVPSFIALLPRIVLFHFLKQSQTWTIDFGTSFHCTPSKDCFLSFSEGKFGNVYLAISIACNIEGLGVAKSDRGEWSRASTISISFSSRDKDELVLGQVDL